MEAVCVSFGCLVLELRGAETRKKKCVVGTSRPCTLLSCMLAPVRGVLHNFAETTPGKVLGHPAGRENDVSIYVHIEDLI